MGRDRWTTVGIALVLLSAGSTLNPLPSQAASEGRVLRLAESRGNTPASNEPSTVGAREPVGVTFALLAARASGASPAQVAPPPDPNGGVRVIYAPDARGPLPPAVTISNSPIPPSFANNPPGANALLASTSPSTMPPMQPQGMTIGPVGGAALTAVGPVGVQQNAAMQAGTVQQNAAVQTANARGAPVLAGSVAGVGAPVLAGSVSSVGAPGSATGPSQMVASVAGGTSGGGSTLAGRVIPNLPASPNGARITSIAQSQLGARYTWAGVSPATGFDCSGFVYWVFNSQNISVPRTLEDQLAAGRRVRIEEMRPGDIVFFTDTYMPGLSHNGIYVGDGKFIHAVDESTGIAITPLNAAYWEQRYYGAVRVID